MTNKHEFAIITPGGSFRFDYTYSSPDVAVEDAMKGTVVMITHAMESGEPFIIESTEDHKPTTIIRFAPDAIVQVVAWDDFEKRNEEQAADKRKAGLTLQGIQQQLQQGPRPPRGRGR